MADKNAPTQNLAQNQNQIAEKLTPISGNDLRADLDNAAPASAAPGMKADPMSPQSLAQNTGHDLSADLNALTPAAGQPFNTKNAPAAPMGSMSPALAASGLATHTLDKPVAGRTEVVQVTPGELIATQFNPESADLSMRGQDLVMSFNDGSKIVLENFAQDTANLPTIALPNGALVAGGIIVAQLQGTNEELFNLETAAGAAANGGGNFIYNDNLGGIIDLLSKLPPILFTQLAFNQPSPFIANLFPIDDAGGNLVPDITTDLPPGHPLNPGASVITVAGGFEDWQAAQHIGSTVQTPMILNINFIPNDNEVVDLCTILNVPAGVLLFYRDDATGVVTPLTLVNGSITLTGAQISAGHVLVLPPANSDLDIPLTVRLNVSDPDTNQTTVIAQNVVGVVDAVADRPDLISSSVSLNGGPAVNGSVSGTEDSNPASATNLNLNVNIAFKDNDGSETHTIVISGVPAGWTMTDNGGLTFVATTNANGTVTYTAVVTTGFNGTLGFDTNNWSSKANGDAVITIIGRAEEEVTDGEIRTDNNTSQVSTTINVHIEEDIPTIVVPNAGSNPVTINESSLTVPGIDQVSANIVVDFKTDNPGSIKLTLDGLNALNLTSHGQTLNYTLSPDGKTITATDPNGNTIFTVVLGTPTTNGNEQTVPYTFTLTGPLDHPPGAGNNTLNIPVKFIATDSDGDTATGSFPITVVDDAPLAGNVTATVDETNPLGVAVNGVLGASLGADGPGSITENNSFNATGSLKNGALSSNGVPVTVTLENGMYVGKANGVTVFTLDIKADGTYTFVQHGPLDHADGTNPNDAITLSFGYTVTDFDGDTVPGTVKITVVDDAPVAHADVASLPNGSNVATGNVIANDTLSKDTPNLLMKVEFPSPVPNGMPIVKFFSNPDGTDANGKFVVINSQFGVLKIYENGNYTYTLNPGTGGAHTEHFVYSLIDGDGDTSANTLTLNIDNGVPGPAPAVVVSVDETTDINGVFSDTIVVPGATQFTLGGAPVPTPDGSLLNGQLTSNGVPVTTTMVNGQIVGMAGNIQVFTLSINNNGTYTFVLKAPLDHADGNNPNDVINLYFSYTAKDADGDAVSNIITIHVRDDAPIAYDDIINVPDGSNVATGNVIANDTLSKDVANVLVQISPNGTPGIPPVKTFANPDGVDANGKFIIMNGNLGTLKIYENGSYTYTVNPNNAGSGTDSFRYGLIDKDGDTSYANLDFNVADGVPGPAPAVTKTVDETTDINVTFTDTITVPGATTFALGGPTSVTGSLAGGALTSNGVPVTVSLVNGQYVGTANGVQIFTLSINSNGTYTFVLKGPLDHADGTNANDVINLNFTYTASDADGDSVSNTITIHVRDDAPIAYDDVIGLQSGNNVATGNVITNDTLSKDVGNVLKDIGITTTLNVPNVKSFSTPDGTDANGKFIFINGQFGVLKIYENGNYTYTVNANNTGNHVDKFVYTLVDRDGDTSSAYLQINIVDGAPGPAPSIIKTVDETSDINNTISDTVTVTGATTYSLGDPTGSVPTGVSGSLAGGALTSNGVPVTISLVNGQYVGMAGAVQVFVLTMNSNGTYTFTLKAPLDHADGNNANDVIKLHFNYGASDADGDTSYGSITVNVLDDAPVAAADIGNIPDGSSIATGNVITNDTLSKDVSNLLKDVSFGGTTVSFSNPTGTDVNGKFIVLNGAYGQLKIYENGNYTYTYNNAAHTGNHTEVFNYTLMDRDGDTSATTLTLNIVDGTPGPAPAVNNTVDETTDINFPVSGTINVPGATQFTLGGPVSTSGSMTGGVLSSNGVPVTISLVNGQYVGMAGAVQVFTLTLNNSGTYTFTQFAPLDHADGSNPNDLIHLTFTYTAKDADGDSVSNTILIHVRDDSPVAVADVAVLNNTLTATGNVMSNDTMSKDVVNLLKDVSFGNSTVSFNNPTGTDANGNYIVINGAYGQLKIYENGNYTYTYNSALHSGNLSEVFNYTLIDRDGDTSSTTLTLNIIDNGPGVPPAIVHTVDETFDINAGITGMINVTNATQFTLGDPSGNGTFTASGSMTGGQLTSNGVPIIVSLVNGQYVGTANGVQIFTLSINSNGQYTFTLKGPLDHADGTNIDDIIDLQFTYTASDVDGDKVTNTITIHVKDDAPDAVDDSASVLGGSNSIATGNILTNDVMSQDVLNKLVDISFGNTVKSMGVPTGSDSFGLYVQLNGAYGTLRVYLNNPGFYRYGLNVNGGVFGSGKTEVFKYTLLDKDGDTDQATLTIHVQQSAAMAADYTVDETFDMNASMQAMAYAPGAVEFKLGTASGAGTFSSNGSLAGGSLKSNGENVIVTLVNGQYVGKTQFSNLTVFTLSIDNAGKYTFVLSRQLDHANTSDPNDVINLNFMYTGKDVNGDTSSSTIVIHVRDDAPLANADSATMTGSSVSGNVVANDVLSKDVVNLISEAKFGSTVKSFATPDGIDASGKFVYVNGTYGQLKLYEGGNYTYTLNGNAPAGNGGVISEVFTYKLKDGDGDTSSTTLTINLSLPKLIVGENVDDYGNSTTPYHIGVGSGTINGSTGDDVLVGDRGGSAVSGQDFNVVMILDTSNSMQGNKLAQLKTAVATLLNEMGQYTGGTVKVHIVTFSTMADPGMTFTITNAADLAAALAFVNGLSVSPNDYTNFESPLQAAIAWLNGWAGNGPIAGGKNLSYFISDGEPNRYVNSTGGASIGSAAQSMNEITGSDGTNEVGDLQALSEVISLGINVNATTLGRLDIIATGNAIDVQNPNDLPDALQGTNPVNNLGAVGNDTINGGDGKDVIFGDSINTDALAQAYNLGTPPGKGWDVFTILETSHGWTRTQTINYIKSHLEEMAHETHNANGDGRTGGNDWIDGGNGDDIIFGQEGNDTIYGGAGNDIISGGSGTNTLYGGAGADTFLFLKGSTGLDIIKDYSNTQSDKLDISDLLTGSGYAPGGNAANYVKIDKITGDVFVDNTGTGSFNSGNKIAHIDNISTATTINVILHDNEGTKTIVTT